MNRLGIIAKAPMLGSDVAKAVKVNKTNHLKLYGILKTFKNIFYAFFDLKLKSAIILFLAKLYT